MSMRDDRKDELGALMTTFATPGFKLYAGDVQGLYESLLDRSIADCDTGEKWMERRGELLALGRIMGYPVAAVQEIENIDSVIFEDEEPDDMGTNGLED